MVHRILLPLHCDDGFDDRSDAAASFVDVVIIFGVTLIGLVVLVMTSLFLVSSCH
jgi:hypothetical protein